MNKPSKNFHKPETADTRPVKLGHQRQHLHGYFSRTMDPVCRIQSGDCVDFSIPDAAWGIENYRVDGKERKTVMPCDPIYDTGHCLAGPVYIEGALPGHTLEIDIEEIIPESWGWTHGGGWNSDYNERLGIASGEQYLMRWELDTERMIGRNELGHEVDLQPFLGVMGMPPDLTGKHTTFPPRNCGGNLDFAGLQKGSRLYLPVALKGALFSCGDGHARQGHGEVSGQAIECAIKSTRLRFNILRNMCIKTPRVWTPEGWYVLGLHSDLEEAMFIALEEMLDLICEEYRVVRKQAIALASAVVDLNITQIVNGTRGVHAYLPHNAIRQDD